MTTIVSFLSKDYIIMGSDSLATYSRPFLGILCVLNLPFGGNSPFRVTDENERSPVDRV